MTTTQTFSRVLELLFYCNSFLHLSYFLLLMQADLPRAGHAYLQDYLHLSFYIRHTGPTPSRLWDLKGFGY